MGVAGHPLPVRRGDVLEREGAGDDDLEPPGAGDAIAALFLAHWLSSRDAGAALGAAAASVHGLLTATEAARSREILLVAAQDEVVAPSRTFPVDEV